MSGLNLVKSDEEIRNLYEVDGKLNDPKNLKGDMRIDPRIITIEEGHNVRRFDNSKVMEHIDELVEGIEEIGLRVPLSVRRVPIGSDKNGLAIYKYILVDGECRLRAIHKLIERGQDFARIPVYLVDEEHSTLEERTLDMIVKNEGLNFTPIELAHAYKRFVNWGYTPAEIARKVGKKVFHVTETLSLLNYDREIQQALAEKDITARNVIQIEKEATRELNRESEDSGRKKIIDRQALTAKVEERLKAALELAREQTRLNQEKAEEEKKEDFKVLRGRDVVNETLRVKTQEDKLQDGLEVVLGFIKYFKNEHPCISLLEDMLVLLKEDKKDVKTAINMTFGVPVKI